MYVQCTMHNVYGRAVSAGQISHENLSFVLFCHNLVCSVIIIYKILQAVFIPTFTPIPETFGLLLNNNNQPSNNERIIKGKKTKKKKQEIHH